MKNVSRRALFALLTLSLAAALLVAYSSAGSAQEIDWTAFLPVTTGGGSGGGTGARLPAADYAELVELNTGAGVWTYEEGVIEILKLMAGERLVNEVPGTEGVDFPEFNAVVNWAFDYLDSGPDTAVRAEIDRLLDLIIVNEENLHLYSIPESQAVNLPDRGLHAANARQAGDNCDALWNQDYPPQDRVANGACFLRKERTLRGRDLIVYYPTDWEDDQKLMTYVNGAMEAMTQSFISYTTYKDDNDALYEMPDASLIFTTRRVGARNVYNPNGTVGAVAPYRHDRIEYGFVDACPIFIYKVLYEESLKNFQQGVAHEMFHCFQDHNLGPQTSFNYGIIEWWAEGTAEYFSNEVPAYRGVNLEHRLLSQFNKDSLSTPLMGLGRETAVFFQFLGNKIGNDMLIQNLEKLPTTAGSGWETQARAVSEKWDGIDALFHQFATDYFDAIIQDSDGSLLPIGAERVLLSAPGATEFNDEEDDVTLEASVFRLSRHRFTYEHPKIFSQLTHGSNVSYSAREIDRTVSTIADLRARTTLWYELDPTLETPCDEDAYYFLVVTSTNVDNHATANKLTNNIEKVEKGKCTCYVKFQLSGGLHGSYTAPGYFLISNNILDITHIVQNSVSYNVGTKPYVAGTTGDFLLGFSVTDNAGAGLIAGVDPDIVGPGTLTILEATPTHISGNFTGQLAGWQPINDPTIRTGTVTGIFRAVDYNSPEGALCRQEWE